MGLLSFFLNKLYKRKLGKLVSARIAEQCESSSPSVPHVGIPLSNMPKKPLNSTIKASPKALALIEKWEGFRAEPYKCTAGVWTIGIGTTVYPNGVKVGERDPEINIHQARLYLQDHLAKHVEPQLSELVGDLVNRNQYDALVSFVYNVGMRAFKESTMLRCIKSGMLEAAAAEFPRWNKSGGKVTAGLIARRKDERSLFETDPNLV